MKTEKGHDKARSLERTYSEKALLAAQNGYVYSLIELLKRIDAMDKRLTQIERVYANSFPIN